MTGAPRYMLDTNSASYVIRGAHPSVAARLRAVPMAHVCISSITQGELLFGLACKPGATNLQIAVSAFLARVEVLPWDSAVATRYGVLRAALNAAGKPLGNLDTLIAAHALTVGAVLVSNDEAFAQVPSLVIENWVKP